MTIHFEFTEEDKLVISDVGQGQIIFDPDEVAELHLFLESRNEQAFKDEHEKIMQGR